DLLRVAGRAHGEWRGWLNKKTASEPELDRQLKHARIAGRGDRAKSGGSEAAVRRTEGRRVHRVENLGAKLEAGSLADCKRLSERQIHRLVSRPAHRIPRTAADRELRRRAESRGVEVAPRRPLCPEL